MIFSTIFDKKANVFFNPILQHTEEEAIRSFQMIKKQEEPIKSFPEDYEMWKLANYDNRTGEITPDKKKLEA